MVLVDTSVWIDHLRRGNRRLAELLDEGVVASHPFVLGEIACGHLKNRDEILSRLAALPTCDVADTDEVLHLLKQEKLYGRGMGWVDAHLLASARLTGRPLWTLDRRLAKVARTLSLDFDPTEP